MVQTFRIASDKIELIIEAEISQSERDNLSVQYVDRVIDAYMEIHDGGETYIFEGPEVIAGIAAAAVARHYKVEDATRFIEAVKVIPFDKLREFVEGSGNLNEIINLTLYWATGGPFLWYDGIYHEVFRHIMTLLNPKGLLDVEIRQRAKELYDIEISKLTDYIGEEVVLHEILNYPELAASIYRHYVRSYFPDLRKFWNQISKSWDAFLDRISRIPMFFISSRHLAKVIDHRVTRVAEVAVIVPTKIPLNALHTSELEKLELKLVELAGGRAQVGDTVTLYIAGPWNEVMDKLTNIVVILMKTEELWNPKRKKKKSKTRAKR